MSSGIPDALPIAEEVADLLHATTRRLRHAARHDLDPLGVTPAQWRALRTVARFREPPRMSELADRLGIARRSATAVVDDLEDRGLLARADDPRDRRSVVVAPTPAGRALLDELSERRRQATARQLAVLSEEELQLLGTLLRRLQADDPPPAPHAHQGPARGRLHDAADRPGVGRGRERGVGPQGG